MKTLRSIFCSRAPKTTTKFESARVRVRRSPDCEALEGRQLLNATWSGQVPTWLGANTSGVTPTAQVHAFSKDAKGRLGKPGDFKGRDMPKPSAQALADMKTLQTDQQKLQSEVPTTLAATIKTDQAVIDKAFASQDRVGLKGRFGTDHARFTPPKDGTTPPANFTPPTGTMPGGPGGSGGPGMGMVSTADLVTRLEAAGVSTAQATQIGTDLDTLKTTLDTVDPTLSAKITADQAALAKDMPAPPVAPASTTTTTSSTSTT